jgi:hypothetical protein
VTLVFPARRRQFLRGHTGDTTFGLEELLRGSISDRSIQNMSDEAILSLRKGGAWRQREKLARIQSLMLDCWVEPATRLAPRVVVPKSSLAAAVFPLIWFRARRSGGRGGIHPYN